MFFYLMVMSGLFYYFRMRGEICFRVNGATACSNLPFQPCSSANKLNSF